MKPLVLTILTITLLLSGCATVQPLTDEQKSKIDKIAIRNELPEIRYQKYGTTIFNNSDEQLIETDIQEAGRQLIVDELEVRGYEVTDNLSDADAVLEIDGVLPGYPMTGVEGLAIFTHTMFGMKHGVQSQVSLCFRLKLLPQEKQIQYHCPYVPGFSEIKKAHNSWTEYSEEEQNLLLENLENYYFTEILNALNNWGL